AAAVPLDDIVADVETEPGTPGLGREKRFEDRAQVFRGDAGALVANADLGPQQAAARAPRQDGDGDRAAGRRRLGGVLDQIDEHLLELVDVVRRRRGVL